MLRLSICSRALAFCFSLLALVLWAFAPVARAQASSVSFPGDSLSGPTYMQILAHEDDDFLFMNPDIANEIAAGVSTVSVYLTAGQACGVTAGAPAEPPAPCPDQGTDGTPPIVDTVPPLVLTREEFAAARQAGLRATYAQMANVANTWTRTLIQPDGVHTV